MKTATPPKFILSIFKWFCHRDLHPFIEGDLYELYAERLRKSGKRTADFTLLLEVIKLFRPSIIKPITGYNKLNQYGMLKNYFTIGWRSIMKQKLYSLINVGGLAVGLTAFILIFIYVRHELSYNSFFENNENIYRMYQIQPGNEYMGTNKFAVTTAGLPRALKDEFPSIGYACSISERPVLIGYENRHFYESGLWADASFFKIFQYDFVEGNPDMAFKDPMSIVITENWAHKVFGDTSAIGKTLVLTSHFGDKEYQITGVIKDPPPSTSFDLKYIANLASNENYMKQLESAKWNSNSYHTFFSIDDEADIKNIEDKLPNLVEKYYGVEEGEEPENILHTQPLKDLYMESDINFDIGKKGNRQYVVLFVIVAVVVLVLACINYMNLAIARSLQRSKEVGLRKAIGAYRGQVILQFLSESILISFLALLLAILLSASLVPMFGNILERPLSFDLFSNIELMFVLLTLILLVGLISGSYPALFISSLKPVNALKGVGLQKTPKLRLQRMLMIFQYTAGIILIIASLVIYHQFDFIQNKELGYDKDRILVVEVRSKELRENMDLAREELRQYAHIGSITTSVSLPSDINSSSKFGTVKNPSKDQISTVYRTGVDHQFLSTFGISLVAGRDFNKEINPEDEGVIINESAANEYGWSANEAIDKILYNGENPYRIIGVVKDFHMFSMHLPIQPLMLILDDSWFNYAAIKINNTDNIQNTILLVEEAFKKHSDYPFEFRFMDDEYDRLYKADIKLMKIFGVFTIISILIASLGLFGLAAYTANLRTKEIGIRKVLGAPVRVLVGLLAKSYLIMVAVGFVIALPIAWYLMHEWLDNYAYKVDMQWWMFGLAAILAFTIAIFTIGTQTLKTAYTNPVDSLKHE